MIKVFLILKIYTKNNKRIFLNNNCIFENYEITLLVNNPQVLKIIENLKGRKNYEEKEPRKLGFASLYAYIENKIKKKEESEPEIANHSEKQLKSVLIIRKSCSCC